MRVNPRDVNEGVPAVSPRKWFIWYSKVEDENHEVMLALDALLADNADDEELCAWASAAKKGDKHVLGGAAPDGIILCEGFVPRDDAEALSKAFVDRLRESLSADDFAEMCLLNAGESNPSVCHSHDFCDANMVMLGAYCALVDLPEDDADLDALVPLFNAAWDLAKPVISHA